MGYETITIKDNERLANRTIENAFIYVEGENTQLSTLRLINCNIVGKWLTKPRWENIRLEGGLSSFQSAITIQGCKGGHFADFSGKQIQRLFYAELSNQSPNFIDCILDGMHAREWSDHFGDPMRSEALLFHGYGGSVDKHIDVEIRNVTVDTGWAGSWLTFWGGGIDRALVRECIAPGRIQIGLLEPIQPIRRIEVDDVLTERPGFIYRTYSYHQPYPPAMLGKVRGPENWKHELRRDQSAVGIFDNVDDLRDHLEPAA